MPKPLAGFLVSLVVLLAAAPRASAATADFRTDPEVARVGQSVTFDASASSGTPPLTYTWDFGDDTGPETAGVRTTHVYTEPGEYAVELQVEDDDYDDATAVHRVVVLDELGRAGGDEPQETARSGPVFAGLFYERTGYRVRKARLRVARDGVEQLDAPLRPICRHCLLSFAEGAALTVRDLDADGEPEILVDGYTGGAHCCSYTTIFRRTASGGYRRTRRDWGNTSYRLVDRDGDGRPEFSSADDRFAYAFSCYACSGRPVRILEYRAVGWRDVTSRFPRVVRRDAALWRRAYRRAARGPDGDGRGFLAAHVADLHRLGRRRLARRVVRAARRRGDLDADRVWPHGARYIEVLERRLRAWGYAR